MSGSLGTAAVMGAGAWGTALAKVLAEAGSDVRLWARRPEVEHEVNAAHTNNRYLRGVTVPSTIRAITSRMSERRRRSRGQTPRISSGS